nr:hypothetical protein [Tanacetum cinerariifolium]
DEGPFQFGMFKETLVEGEEGAFHPGPERPRVYSDLSLEEKDGFVTAVKLNRGLRDSNYDQLYDYLKQHEAYANENKMMLDRFTQNTVDPLALMSNVSHQQYYSQSSTTPPFISVQSHFADNTQLDLGLSPTNNLIKNLTNTLALLTQSYKTYLSQTNNQLRTSSNARNQGTTMFMANLSSTYPVYDEAGPSYDSDILSKVHDHDHYQDAVCKHHEVHEMHDDVQPVVDSHEVQPALYNGHEIIKTNHVLAIVHNSEETLEIAEITRKKMNDKMKD